MFEEQEEFTKLKPFQLILFEKVIYIIVSIMALQFWYEELSFISQFFSFKNLIANISIALIGLSILQLVLIPFFIKRKIKIESNEYTAVVFKANYRIIDFFLLSLSIAFAEELFFRGIILTIAGEVFGQWIGLAIATLVYSIMHFSHFGNSLSWNIVILMIGLICGILFITTGTLWAPIVLQSLFHMSNCILVKRGYVLKIEA